MLFFTLLNRHARRTKGARHIKVKSVALVNTSAQSANENGCRVRNITIFAISIFWFLAYQIAGNSWANMSQDCIKCHIKVYPHKQVCQLIANQISFFFSNRKLFPIFICSVRWKHQTVWTFQINRNCIHKPYAKNVNRLVTTAEEAIIVKGCWWVGLRRRCTNRWGGGALVD